MNDPGADSIPPILFYKAQFLHLLSTLSYLVAHRFIVIIRVQSLVTGPKAGVAVVRAGVRGQGPGVVEVIKKRVQVVNVLLQSARGPVSVLIKHSIRSGVRTQQSLSTRSVLV